ncbi:30S ribosomal protein S9 [candidate division WWE3 bacterium CG09_land_8_20_14_0_10_39_24]|uniref:30S ribosomal protein S9 n=2 Tax=Katanobacteria TaxID=422282 RepID=A0A2G9XCP8_UNCKA|nr:MAG: 30S ribosomal protein S9 [bacterium CG2_30_40_12]PIP04768.1 MAG: 30S ribosomal protein S9 [candidate division WWE3 bacterium CG23_combo_of_CG06-09_8_20_14_all_40_14]PIS12793.1 MAG: 30S ribosomal protein S9 [candidate division WWE3 bacterium CG09_land_8_20_14_0_10_39_24]PJE50814.1 MAG: 30S ribosomal protein S9 [candidate division WWE3 bacterium CG10_big_fil_rev_8_21_14_0_10_39_14]
MPKKTEKKFYSGTGRRKRAVAAVWLFDKKGDITINGVYARDYFKNEKERLIWIKPFHIVGVAHPAAKFSATVKLYGGGKSSQVEALSLGFSKALVSYDAGFRDKLRKAGLLTRDSREVESKKYYKRKARKKQQYSKR